MNLEELEIFNVDNPDHVELIKFNIDKDYEENFVY